jgi:4'-phosphopantetheinyl transferase
MRPVPALAAGECQVWWADCSAANDRLLDLLEPAEIGRWERFRVPRARELFVVAHALARLVVGSRLGVPAADLRFDVTCPRCGQPHGKPRLTGIELSISHSGEAVLVAVALGQAIGVDVEQLTARADELAGMVLGDTERAVLDALPEDRRPAAFTRYWTRKEAVVKATGDGLTVPLDSVVVSGPDEEPVLLQWTAGPDTPVHLTDLAAPAGYLAALATLGGGLCVVEIDATELLLDAGRR